MDDHVFKGDSTNKAKIENILLLKLMVTFSEIFFVEFVVGMYLIHGWTMDIQETPLRGQAANRCIVPCP